MCTVQFLGISPIRKSRSLLWKIGKKIGSCERGENPAMMVKMKSGFAVMADNQFLPGYCVFLKYPQVTSIQSLTLKERAQYFMDTTLVGEAIMKVCSPRIVNYSTLMNREAYLHTHIEARYDWETEEYKYKPSWIYPEDERYHEKYAFSEERHGELKKQMTDFLIERMSRDDYLAL